MITQHDLDELGRQLSQDFISDNIALNDGLKKVASEKGLNREQLQRVAEAANTDTYLNLMKTAKENYVDFPLADYRDVYEGMNKTAQANPFALDDYDTDYETVAHEFAEDISDSSIEKTASAEEDTEPTTERYKQAIESRDTVKYLGNAADESLSEINHTYESLEKEAKQIILSGIPFNNIPHILKHASEYASDSIVEYLKPRLAKYSPFTDLEKEASIEGRVNPQSSLYKIASKLQNDIIRYLKISDAIHHHHNKYAEFVEKYNLPLVKESGDIAKTLVHGTKAIGKGVGGLVTGVMKHPVLAGGAGLYLIGRSVGKKKGRRMQGKIMSERAQYKGKNKNILRQLRKQR